MEQVKGQDRLRGGQVPQGAEVRVDSFKLLSKVGNLDPVDKGEDDKGRVLLEHSGISVHEVSLLRLLDDAALLVKLAVPLVKLLSPPQSSDVAFAANGLLEVVLVALKGRKLVAEYVDGDADHERAEERHLQQAKVVELSSDQPVCFFRG